MKGHRAGVCSTSAVFFARIFVLMHATMRHCLRVPGVSFKSPEKWVRQEMGDRWDDLPQ